MDSFFKSQFSHYILDMLDKALWLYLIASMRIQNSFASLSNLSFSFTIPSFVHVPGALKNLFDLGKHKLLGDAIILPPSLRLTGSEWGSPGKLTPVWPVSPGCSPLFMTQNPFSKKKWILKQRLWLPCSPVYSSNPLQCPVISQSRGERGDNLVPPLPSSTVSWVHINGPDITWHKVLSSMFLHTPLGRWSTRIMSPQLWISVSQHIFNAFQWSIALIA